MRFYIPEVAMNRWTVALNGLLLALFFVTGCSGSRNPAVPDNNPDFTSQNPPMARNSVNYITISIFSTVTDVRGSDTRIPAT